MDFHKRKLAALKAVEHAAMFKHDSGWKPSRQCSSEVPPEWEVAELGLFKEPYEFGERIMVAV